MTLKGDALKYLCANKTKKQNIFIYRARDSFNEVRFVDFVGKPNIGSTLAYWKISVIQPINFMCECSNWNSVKFYEILSPLWFFFFFNFFYHRTNCSVHPDLLCLGNRTFSKRLRCNWTHGYRWSTALFISITLGGFGADR